MGTSAFMLLALLFAVAASMEIVRPIENKCDDIYYQWWAVESSQGARRYQEDRVLVEGICVGEQSLGLFAIFDGHIGHQASEFLAANFKQELEEQLRLTPSDTNLKDHALTRTLVSLDAQFLKRAAQERLPAGSTACVALVNKDKGYLVVSNVGDSRAMLCKAQGGGTKLQHVALTKDDLPTDRSERRRIEASGGRVRNGVINGHFPMSRAIGDLPMRRFGVIGLPTTRLVELQPGDDGFLVIVSDGILEGMTEQDICSMIEDETRLSSHTHLIAQSVLNKASLASSDNLSIVLVPLV